MRVEPAYFETEVCGLRRSFLSPRVEGAFTLTESSKYKNGVIHNINGHMKSSKQRQASTAHIALNWWHYFITLWHLLWPFLGPFCSISSSYEVIYVRYMHVHMHKSSVNSQTVEPTSVSRHAQPSKRNILSSYEVIFWSHSSCRYVHKCRKVATVSVYFTRKACEAIKTKE